MNEWSQSLASEFTDKEYAHDYADELLYAYIATQIKVLRQQQELTQEALAEASGMKQERISVLEDVNYSSWTINTLLKLARAFDLRLRVSFENFSTVLDDMFVLSAESLRRTKREEDIKLLTKNTPDVNFTGSASTSQKKVEEKILDAAFASGFSPYVKINPVLTQTAQVPFLQ